MTDIRTGMERVVDRRAATPTDVPAPVLDSFADRTYDAVLPLAWLDADTGWHLALFCAAIGVMFQAVEDVARDTPDAPGWSAVLDVDRCPPDWLPWLAQFVGVVIPSGTTDVAAMRDLVRTRPNFNRGTVNALKNAASANLTGNKTVYFRERYGGDPYALQIVTLAYESPPSDSGEPANMVTNPSSEVTLGWGSASASTTTPANLVTNPSAELNITGWNASASSVGQPTAIFTQSNAWAKAGGFSAYSKVTRGDASPVGVVVRPSNIGVNAIPVVAGASYAVRVSLNIVRNDSALGTSFRVYWYKADGSAATGTLTTVLGYVPGVGLRDWSGIAVAPADAAFGVPTLYTSLGDVVPQVWEGYVDAFMLAVATVVPAYADGDTFGFRWSGAAHASTTLPNVAARVLSTDWAAPGAGTKSCRYTVTRDDAAACSVRSDGGTDQGSSGRFAVNPSHFYAFRTRGRLRSTSVQIASAFMSVAWFKADNATGATTPLTNGPTVTPALGAEFDMVVIAKPPADGGFVGIRPTFGLPAGMATADVDVDAALMVDLGPTYTGPVGTLTNAADVPAYFDGNTAGHLWAGTPHASVSRSPVTHIVADALAPAKPAGIVMDYHTIAGWDYTQMTTEGGAYSSLPAKFSTYADLRENTRKP